MRRPNESGRGGGVWELGRVLRRQAKQLEELTPEEYPSFEHPGSSPGPGGIIVEVNGRMYVNFCRKN